ncbi:MBL fold metallo-hydrolase [Palleronia sp.]|uniref:MBL fold metallo-hydrolase n=1 Tax=Palleronia sp. TaxID=1940284 RepID=UPI0035C7A379
MTSDGGTIRYIHETPPEFGVPTPVADGIEWLRLPLPMALDHVNCWLLDEGDGAVTVVDTGFDSRKTRDLWNRALDGRRVTRVVVTHHHPDHVGLAGWFQAEHGAELLMPRTGWLMARMLTLDVHERPTPETLAYWRAAGMPPEMIETRAAERPFNFADVVAPLPLGYRRLTNEDMICLGGRWWHIHCGDGHAPEHATLWEEDGPLILGGDQLLPSISPNLGTYATEPEADPVGDWLASCERFRGLATPDRIVLPGHKLPFQGLPTRLRQLVENHEGALDRLRSHLAEPRSAVECFRPVFKREIREAEFGLALVEAVAHCQHLVHRGEALRETDADGVWRFALR